MIKKKQENVLSIEDEEEPKTDKQREIEEAWREYYEQKYS